MIIHQRNNTAAPIGVPPFSCGDSGMRNSLLCRAISLADPRADYRSLTNEIIVLRVNCFASAEKAA